MATCFFLFSHHICLCSFDSTFWNCLFLCVGVIRKYVQALSDITVFMLQKRNCVFEKNISTVDKNNQPRTVLRWQPACQPSHEKLSLNSCYDIIWMGQNLYTYIYMWGRAKHDKTTILPFDLRSHLVVKPFEHFILFIFHFNFWSKSHLAFQLPELPFPFWEADHVHLELPLHFVHLVMMMMVCLRMVINSLSTWVSISHRTSNCYIS